MCEVCSSDIHRTDLHGVNEQLNQNGWGLKKLFFSRTLVCKREEGRNPSVNMTEIWMTVWMKRKGTQSENRWDFKLTWNRFARGKMSVMQRVKDRPRVSRPWSGAYIRAATFNMCCCQAGTIYWNNHTIDCGIVAIERECNGNLDKRYQGSTLNAYLSHIWNHRYHRRLAPHLNVGRSFFSPDHFITQSSGIVSKISRQRCLVW